MTSESVSNFYNWLKQNGITVWIDGGWGVDALFGRQTRDHADLDIAVQRKDNANLRQLLENNGYKEEKRDDSSEFMYFMKSEAGQGVDIHAFEYDENGKNIYGIQYPFGSLTGTGQISGQEVNCIDPKFMFQFKTGYEPKEKDLQDVRALSNEFGFELPEKYAKVYAYEAVIKTSEIGTGGAYVPFPYDLRTEFGKGRIKVRATFDGEHYDGSIVNMGVKNPDGSICYVIGVLKDIRARIGKQPGDTVRVTIRERY